MPDAEAAGNKVSACLQLLDPAALTSIVIEALPKDRNPILSLRRFSRLESLELSANRAPLPSGTAALLEGLAPSLRYLSLYSWRGRSRWENDTPALRPFPANLLAVLPTLGALTALQLGGAQLPPPSSLTALSNLQHLSLHVQNTWAAVLPPLPTPTMFPALLACCLDYVSPDKARWAASAASVRAVLWQPLQLPLPLPLTHRRPNRRRACPCSAPGGGSHTERVPCCLHL